MPSAVPPPASSACTAPSPAPLAAPVTARRRRSRALVTVAVASLVLVACTSTPSPPGSTGGPTTGPDGGQVEETTYTGERAATVRVPADPTAVLVLVPGGGWSSADPTGLRLLGEQLAPEGLASVTITYGTSSTGDRYPVPAQEVACAVAFAAARVPDVPVVVIGHSAGANLALLVGLRPDQGGECAHAPASADGVVGLAGPYDVTRTGSVGRNLFGVPLGEDPDLWAEGNPVTWVAERPELPVLLLHGEADREVGLAASQGAYRALAEAGHDVELVTYPDVEHNGLLRHDVVGADVVSWVRGLADS